MSKFPLLEQMRADRRRRDDEATAPVRTELGHAYAKMDRLEGTLRRRPRDRATILDIRVPELGFRKAMVA